MEDRIVRAKEWTPSDTFRTEYLPRALVLLKGISSDPERNKWCLDYSIYSPCEDVFGIDNEVSWFIKASYSEGLVVKDYGEYMEHYDRNVYEAKTDWVETLSLERLLASIAIHFRRDYHCNGSLINESIPSGAMLRLMEELERRTS